MNKKQRKYEEHRREKVDSHTNIFTVKDCACLYIFLFISTKHERVFNAIPIFVYLNFADDGRNQVRTRKKTC